MQTDFLLHRRTNFHTEFKVRYFLLVLVFVQVESPRVALVLEFNLLSHKFTQQSRLFLIYFISNGYSQSINELSSKPQDLFINCNII